MPQINSYEAKDSELHPNQSPYLWPPVLEHTGTFRKKAAQSTQTARRDKHAKAGVLGANQSPCSRPSPDKAPGECRQVIPVLPFSLDRKWDR